MSYLDQEIILAQHEATIFSLAHGVSVDVMLDSMAMLALEGYLEEAEGIRLGVSDYLYKHKGQNCTVKPLVLQDAEQWEGYVDEGYEGIEDEDEDNDE